MVLCHQIDPFGRCDASGDDSSINEFSFITPKCGNACDCSGIVGRDHLKEKRAKKFRCKSKRIKLLADPKQVTPKFCKASVAAGGPSIEIVRPDDEQTPVRIKMLAFPKVRKLVSSREAYKRVVDKEWFDRFDSLINRSMRTLYSRLSNVQLSGKCPRQKWTKEDWKRHCEWLKKNALPKTEKSPTPIERKPVPLDKLIPSIQKLSAPRSPREKYRQQCGYVSTVKESSLLYEPNDRILELAVPKQRTVEADETEFKPFSVSPAALMYKPTKHIKLLAVPKAQPKKPTDEAILTEFGVVKRALTAAPKPHLDELAKPKERSDDDGSVEKPFVSKAALKAKPTKRILELSEPRKVFTD